MGSRGPVEEVASNTLPSATLTALTELYGAGPPGRFLKGRHGVTHFLLQEPSAGTRGSRIAVLSHGLGTELAVYDGPVTQSLLAAGYRVLSYDFLGHGWSVAADTYHRYEKEVFVTQVTELLDHLLAPGQPVDLFVGHSTGGLVGILLAMSRSRPIKDLALISPALWTHKPLIARLFERFYESMFSLVKNVSAMRPVLENGYQENNDQAFGKIGKKYLHPEKHLMMREKITKKFKLHPQVLLGIASIASFFLREEMLVHWRAEMKELVSKANENWAPKITLLWGKVDVVVPFPFAKQAVSWASTPGRVVLVPLDAGHESTIEIPEILAREILKIGGTAPSRL